MGRQPKGEEYARLVLTTIREIREEHHACTSREIGRRLKVDHQIINRQFDVLRKAELVDATNMPGSIHLTAKGGKVASGGKMPELGFKKVAAVTAGDAPPESPWPPPPPSAAPADMRA